MNSLIVQVSYSTFSEPPGSYAMCKHGWILRWDGGAA